MIITILAAIFVFGMIVTIHEFGHFIVAKACGMRVHEFAVGMGPVLYKKQYGETLYALRLLPLGGYNKIDGMDPEEETDERGFSNKPVWQRFLVISAGAAFNFLLAIVLFFAVFATYGTEKASQEAVIGGLTADGPAMAAHLAEGDRILSINHTPIEQWTDISKALKGHSKQVVPVVIERNGVQQEVSLIPEDNGDRVVIGILPHMTSQSYSVGEAFVSSITRTFDMIIDMFGAIGDMITGHMKADVSGPIGVAQMAGQVAHNGFKALVLFTAILSINLGVINLLPVPVLDGGHLVMLIIEGVSRRKLPAKALQYIQMTGVVLLIGLFIYSTTSDIARLWH